MMRTYGCFLFLWLWLLGCKQEYAPPEIRQANRYLVVEGVINTAPDARTTIRLSRTRRLADTVVQNPEGGAKVQVESKSGAVYHLQEQAGSTYVAERLTLGTADQYRLRIRTSDGSEYLSDFVPVKRTPPIDSVSWKQEDDLSLFVSTHDPTNQARYYRWDYVETWQYQAYLVTNGGIGLANGRMYYLDPADQVYTCWSTVASTEIVLGSSLRLNQDVIAQFPIATIPKNSARLDIRYSALVRQYALTEEAYAYWEILRKNSQTLGSLFDAQPGQLFSNLHNVADAAEPVIGFVSACNVTERRIFISNSDLVNWHSVINVPYCGEQSISQNPTDPFLWTYPDTSYGPWYFLSPAGIMIAKKDCIDCRRRGGTNQKPAFW